MRLPRSMSAPTLLSIATSASMEHRPEGGIRLRSVGAKASAFVRLWMAGMVLVMSAARIGKIRLKSGGAEVRVLGRDCRPDGESYKGLIVQHARAIADTTDDMVGFVVVGIFADGTHNCGFRLDKDCVVGRTMLPSYVADVVRRYALIEPIADGEV